ncbi:MAG: class I SAM-dependent methyltransferase [Dehalococcoidia bacterium]|nr:class I SAM-dependent methyltransferase [Dehalococcoidia bacterium]
MMTPPTPLDFATTWTRFSRYTMRERISDDAEIAFWQRHAQAYDHAVQQDPDSYRETLAAVRSMLRPDDTLLDVGAGAGRFTLPLASVVRHVTALDLSPHMLALLERRAAGRHPNITTVVGNWEDTPVAPHDAALAAWSLYRQRDILASLRKLMATTRRILMIIDGDYAPRPDDDPPHERIKADIWGPGDPGVCNYLYLAGALRQCGARADVRVVTERLTRTAPDLPTLARMLAPDEATPNEIATFADRLAPFVDTGAAGVVYTCRFAVGMVIWRRP